jgi:hypothetical protein
MILDAFKNISFEKNIEAESPKKEYKKNKTKGILITLFFIKKKIKKTGINKGFVDCKNNASSLRLPITFRTINKNNAPKNILLKLNKNKRFIIQ